MAARPRAFASIELLMVLALVACSGERSEPIAPSGVGPAAAARGSNRQVGTVYIRTTTTGTDLDADGYVIALDSGATKSGPQSIGPNATVKFPNVNAGSRTVTLSGLADNCTVPSTAQSFLLDAGSSVTITFEITCSASVTTGDLVLTVSTTGSDLDPDGYTATIDGGFASQAVAVDGSVTFENLAAGSHTVELSGLAANCTTVDSPRTVAITAGETAAAAMAVTCQPVTTTGDILVTVATTGSDLDPDGYTVTLDGDAQSRSVASNDTVRFAAVAEGAHTVALSAGSVAPNCTPSSSDPQTVNVTAGATAAVSFAVNCAAPPSTFFTFVGAGDIASCSYDQDEATAKLLDAVVASDPAATVFTLGDNAYEDGSASDYANCYHPTWGRHRNRTWVALGNHDYQSVKAIGDASPTWDYFGDRAGPRGLGYYSLDLGDWHVIVLNDNSYYGGPGDWPGTRQDAWLQADLAASTKRCTIAIWHQPYVASGVLDSSRRWFWDRLYAAGVEIVLSGHKHRYERLAPMTPDLVRDDDRGIRAFIVGTGGGDNAMPASVSANTEAVSAASGVLKLTLGNGTYGWEFMPIAGQSFTDSGSGTCH